MFLNLNDKTNNITEHIFNYSDRLVPVCSNVFRTESTDICVIRICPSLK